MEKERKQKFKNERDEKVKDYEALAASTETAVDCDHRLLVKLRSKYIKTQPYSMAIMWSV